MLLWAYANGYAPMIDPAENPVGFVALFFLVPFVHEVGFYFAHRLLHWPPLFRVAHKLHHRNVNPIPWSGLSMHPIEHIMYLSSGLIHWLVISHPIHFLFHMQMKALEAVTSHTGYESLLVRDDRGVDLGDFFHQLHHRYFECNYGTLEMPWDKWFGTFHNGDESQTERFRERRRRMHFGA
jgi:sterol desaturase/sphingolipid hydroxylase (fatty acid hydroxylase superfamily)